MRGGTHAAAATETHCVVGGLSYTDALHTTALPRLRHGRTSGCGRAAYPLHTRTKRSPDGTVSRRKAGAGGTRRGRAASPERAGAHGRGKAYIPGGPRDRGSSTGLGAAVGITRHGEMDMVSVPSRAGPSMQARARVGSRDSQPRLRGQRHHLCVACA